MPVEKNINQDDRRVKKTKQALIDALCSIMLEKEIHKITIKELTDRADMHRATFYVHYQDIYDLYEKIQEETFTSIKEIIVSKSDHEYSGLYATLIHSIYKNKQLFTMLLGKQADICFIEKIIDILEEQYLEIWEYETGDEPSGNKLHYLTHYHIQGCLAMIRKWIINEYNMPTELLVEYMKLVDDNFDKIV